MNIRVKITRVGQPHRGEVVTLDMEQYLVGVVASEMSDKWPIEALKAQAIAARTYAVGHIRPSALFDVDDTVKYQAYRARKPGACPNVEAAVRATAGMVLLFNGRPISAVYSASNGGKTRSSKERWGSERPYLISKPDPWDAATKLPRLGHGVGMSQRGAQWAANRGIEFRDILAFYYPGAWLVGGYGAGDNVPPPKPKPVPATLRHGSHGTLVRDLQVLLGTALRKKITIDGDFGDQTDAAVRAYQRKFGLEPDGIVGPQTWAALLK